MASHDIIARVFVRLEPQQLQQCFLNWIQAVAQLSCGSVIAMEWKNPAPFR
ncbi:hypothetical protein [Moorena sp. SIO3B2]|uniref:hypothetical protein n=1 Tax=Moorena sp. SIO3B2 TaxID=2607827 RepID=UPI0009F2B2AE|nr:transposase family protein [Moorena sp. SIO3B2]